MGQTIKLIDTQWEQLDHLRMSTASADVFRNCTIILMSAAGRSKVLISRDLGCCTNTVARVRRLYRKGDMYLTWAIIFLIPMVLIILKNRNALSVLSYN